MIGADEIAEVVDTLRSDWITTGPKVKRFEEHFAEFLECDDAIAVSSCTAALHLSLLALGIGKGDAVITTPLTFCSGVNVIEHVGATPILADVEPDTLNMDAEQVQLQIQRAETQLGLRVRAILPVHLYGHPCNRDAMLELARTHRLAIIEDAAHALPARYKGHQIGYPDRSENVPVVTCFSFYATKNMTTAEGGMLTGPADLLREARSWSLHGMNRDALKRYGASGSWFYDVVHPGFKYNMTDIQAALGIHQLRKLLQFHARRRAIVGKYNAAFQGYEEFGIPRERREVEHAWHLYVLRLNLNVLRITRDEFISELRERNIGCSVHFIPIHLHRYYREKYGYKPEDFPVAFREYQGIVSLPLSPRMNDADVEDVISAITDIAEHSRRRSSQALDVANV